MEPCRWRWKQMVAGKRTVLASLDDSSALCTNKCGVQLSTDISRVQQLDERFDGVQVSGRMGIQGKRRWDLRSSAYGRDQRKQLRLPIDLSAARNPNQAVKIGRASCRERV